MPGGRLTHEERKDIARGLADGLTYTEIARRLQRPVSTISREVIRNGGAGGYHPDRAQRATGDRARRGRPAVPGATPALPDAHGRDPETVRLLEERFTAMLVDTGLPRTTARVLASLYVTDSGSLTAAELVRRLGLSPASISKAVGQLEEQRLIRRDRDPRRRRDRYVIDGDIWYESWLASARRNIRLARVARDGAETLGRGTPAGARLATMGRLLQRLGDDMVRAAERWHDDHDDHRDDGDRDDHDDREDR
ncbi:GbsR/MarR family transcriptional regulator [Nonomuraea rhodomycinica]|uniref:Helix-turn-helix domain-containing protein n=1 Tax=Nonomuraea rhodomycinica TaxID=1712872 RepID=A0A7Y6MD87_9ACTN|nr:helix-turn-helix domain-containing protein [Nonomuraea rhodomycinica]NUW43607.1 helix-turn-helix domain-containing protein [Nonomuraea rhodomycinica]